MSTGIQFDELKSHNELHDFGTGAVRDTRKGKGRFDLLPVYAMFRLARHFEKGGLKYGDRNWELGQNLSDYLSSAIRHLLKHLLGLRDEDHLAAALWNISCMIDTDIQIRLGKLPDKLNDLPDEINPGQAEEILKILEGFLPALDKEEDLTT